MVNDLMLARDKGSRLEAAEAVIGGWITVLVSHFGQSWTR